jgi:hypothetical protein
METRMMIAMKIVDDGYRIDDCIQYRYLGEREEQRAAATTSWKKAAAAA